MSEIRVTALEIHVAVAVTLTLAKISKRRSLDRTTARNVDFTRGINRSLRQTERYGNQNQEYMLQHVCNHALGRVVPGIDSWNEPGLQVIPVHWTTRKARPNLASVYHPRQPAAANSRVAKPFVISEKWVDVGRDCGSTRGRVIHSFFLLGHTTTEVAPLFVVFEGWEPRTGTS